MNADLLFKGATVIDGGGEARFVGDVAVTGERIVAVGENLSLTVGREVDAKGLVLCPGFVDPHGHSDYLLMVLPTSDGKLRQGITTEVGGNCGYSAAPVAGTVASDRKESHRDLYGLEIDWESFDGYLTRLESARPAMNYAGQVGFNTVRGSAGLFSAGAPTADELARMKAMIEESLAAGAFGMSLGLIYPPGTFAALDELIACAKSVAAAGGIVSSHIRSEGDRLIEAIKESVDVAAGSGAAFQVSHLKTSGSGNWGKLERVFELIEGARAEGHVITADRYPYLASFTQLSAALPEWVFEGGKETFFSRLGYTDVRDRIREELAATDTIGDRWERIEISIVYDDELKQYEGRTVAEAADAEGRDPVDFLCEVVVKAKDRAAATYHTMSTGNLELILRKDWVMAGTDAAVRSDVGVLSEGKPHPRAYGTMPRMLSWVSRDRGWLTLESAVRKMTHDPCQTFGIKDRGLVREGQYADLVLFDPERVKDRATYDHPQQYPDGIEMVVVNGKIAVEGGELTSERSGKVLRKE